jgi:hypothetical protein
MCGMTLDAKFSRTRKIPNRGFALHDNRGWAFVYRMAVDVVIIGWIGPLSLQGTFLAIMPLFKMVRTKVWIALIHTVGLVSITWLASELFKNLFFVLASTPRLQRQETERNDNIDVVDGDDDKRSRSIPSSFKVLNRIASNLADWGARELLYMHSRRKFERCRTIPIEDTTEEDDNDEETITDTSSNAFDVQYDGHQFTISTDTGTNSILTKYNQNELEHNGPYYPHLSGFVSKHFPTAGNFREGRK